MKTFLYLIRHGQTDWNEKRLLQGWSDRPLTKLGRDQARDAAKILQKKQINAIYSSPLVRSYETAKAIALHHKLTVSTDESLKERSYGLFEGLSLRKIAEHPEFLKHQNTLNTYTGRPPQGESYFDMYQRVSAFLDRIINNHQNETIAVVSHAGVMKTIAYHARIIKKSELHTIDILNAQSYIVRFDHHNRSYAPVHFPLKQIQIK